MKKPKGNLLIRLARRVIQERRTVWKLVFALIALADILGCWPVFLEGWKSAVHHRKPGVSLPFELDPLFFLHNHNKNKNHNNSSDSDDDNTCASYSIYYAMMGKMLTILTWMGPLFCLLCIVEAVLRARQAREEMLEMAALDNFEKKLARLYGSTRRLQTNLEDNHNNNNSSSSDLATSTEETTYEEDDIMARRTLRSFLPVLSTLLLWALLLPWKTLLRTECGQEADTALATIWITESLKQMAKATSVAMDTLIGWAWAIVVPFSFFWQPHKLYKRILSLLRWVRYFRFAGPLLRILFKVNDQFWVFFKTQKQAWRLRTEKAKRELRRSMLFDDIRKIESLNKLHGLLRVPTQHIFNMVTEQSTNVGTMIEAKKKQGKRLKKELDSLKEQIRRSSKIFPSSELYDRIVDLSQELTTTVGTTLWSANLISPQTRFSLSWRIIVTCALLSEVSRICTSYQLYGRVDVSYTTMMMSVLGCAQDRGGNILTTTGRWTRKLVRKLIRLPQEQLLSTCTKSSISSHTLASLLLRMSGAFETAIDVVCFIDIYVWFFTGELDMDGRVVPKPFFYRCILPGTLVQVLDHPTVPDVLPNLLFYSLSAARAVGYSRMIRWMVAVIPALNLLLVDPIKRFLFRPMAPEEWLQYTESMAIFPVISGADIRYAVSMSHPNLRDMQRMSHPNLRDIQRKENIKFIARQSYASFMPSTSSKRSFVPNMAFSEMPRRESSSAGLNLDSQHVPTMDDDSSFFASPMLDSSFRFNQALLMTKEPRPKSDYRRPQVGFLPSSYGRSTNRLASSGSGGAQKYDRLKEIPTIVSAMNSFEDDDEEEDDSGIILEAPIYMATARSEESTKQTDDNDDKKVRTAATTREELEDEDDDYAIIAAQSDKTTGTAKRSPSQNDEDDEKISAATASEPNKPSNNDSDNDHDNDEAAVVLGGISPAKGTIATAPVSSDRPETLRTDGMHDAPDKLTSAPPESEKKVTFVQDLQRQEQHPDQ